MRTYNWGILGLGNIARKFATDLRHVLGANLHAVASRSQGKAQAFATEFGVPYAVGSYAGLPAVPNLDVVYIATPHSEHYAHARLCVRAGLAVLCEKPFTVNASQARALAALAQARGVFLMEAFWTRFFPAVAQALALVRAGAIGEVTHLVADLGGVVPYDPQSRLFDPALAGGSLLDIGVYPLFLSQLFLGQPTAVAAEAELAPTGVDLSCTLNLTYASGATASLASTLTAQLANHCVLHGTGGELRLLGPLYAPSGVRVLPRGRGRVQDFAYPPPGEGYHYEAAHVQACLSQGLRQSPLLPLSFSLELMDLLDAVRQRIGLRYPGEEEATSPAGN